MTPSVRRRTTVVVVFVTVVVAVAAAISVVLLRRSDSPPAPSGPRSIVFYGDSLTRGAYTSVPQGAFPYLVAAALAHDGELPKSVVAADYGVDSEDFLRRVPGPPAAADLYVVELGTNDLGTPASVFTATYERILNSLDKPASATLVCLGVWAPPQVDGPLDAVISDSCGRHGGRFVSIAELYADPANRGPAGRVLQGLPTDALHPNDAGHAAIARAVYDAVEQQERSTT